MPLSRSSFSRQTARWPLVFSFLFACSSAPLPPPPTSGPPPSTLVVATQAADPPPAPSAVVPLPASAAVPPEKPIATSSLPTKELPVVQSVELGKWPARIALVGDYAWVAESGIHRVSKVDITTGKIAAQVNVGRLPVEVLVGQDESVYVLEHTQRTVRKISNKGVVSEFAQLPDVPEHMAIDGEALWVLLWEKGSSADSTVVRIDLKTKAQKRSAQLGPNAWQIGVNEKHVWVGHDTKISVLDKATVQAKPAITSSDGLPPENVQVRTEFGRIAVGSKSVYGDFNLGVFRIDPQTLTVVKRKRLGQMPMFMIAQGDALWVATREGSIFQLDAESLDIRAEYKPAERLVVQGFAVRDGLAYITEYPRPNAADKEEGWLRTYRLNAAPPINK